MKLKFQLRSFCVFAISLGAALIGQSEAAMAQASPDMGRLSQSGYVIRSRDSSFKTHPSWTQMDKLMKQSAVFDRVVNQISSVICGTDTNRSILVVGEPTDTWRYIFSRLAMKDDANTCANSSHVEIDISKIEAGHMYVGQVDQYWQEEILAPADGKDVVLYLSSLNQLMGLGSHSHDDTGIEAEYSNNISAGRLRSVAFMNKFEYEYYIRSKDAYVLNSFALTLKLDNMELSEVNELQQDYLRVLAPGFKLVPQEQAFLNRTVNFYLPNVFEPQRSINVLKKLIQKHDGIGSVELTREDVAVSDLETPHPYPSSTKWERTISYPDAAKLQLRFKSFATESRYDELKITNADSGVVLATYSGSKGAFETEVFDSPNLNLKFTSDNSNENDGFIIDQVSVFSVPAGASLDVVFEREEIRRTIMEIAQVPGWLIDREFGPIKKLQENLDGDVVGCHQAKADAVRLAKVGYVGGRTDEKPVAAHMFVGPTGTGKSYIAKKMADFLGIKLITFDMTAYRTPESFDRFLDTLSESLILYPFAIYLFEEVDKADSKILDRLYFMTDEGILYDKFQRPLFARGAYIIITTNAAEDIIINTPDAPNLQDLVDAELRKMFRPSFLNRLDAVSIFKPFSQAEYHQLAGIMVKKKIAAAREIFDWNMAVDQKSIQYIGKYGQSARYGARPMERLIDSVVTAGVAEFQLEYGPIAAGGGIGVTKREPTHEFMVSSDGKDIAYTVDPRSNGGGLMTPLDPKRAMVQAYQYKMRQKLETMAIWSDRD
jgi:hypothetical protein